MCDWLNAFSTFLLLYMALAVDNMGVTLSIDKMDGCDLSNTACCECLSRRLR